MDQRITPRRRDGRKRNGGEPADQYNPGHLTRERAIRLLKNPVKGHCYVPIGSRVSGRESKQPGIECYPHLPGGEDRERGLIRYKEGGEITPITDAYQRVICSYR
jgi:hypothetical protein